MEWWQTLLMTGGTCLVTLLVTFIFNWITNRPAVKAKKEERERQKRQEELDQLKDNLLKAIDEVKSEKIRERAACQEDHCALVKIVKDIQATNKAQNAGLQSVLRDLLKIRYLSWIEKGYTTIDAKDDLEKMYQSYHNLGGNSTITELRNKFIKLPLREEIDK